MQKSITTIPNLYKQCNLRPTSADASVPNINVAGHNGSVKPDIKAFRVFIFKDMFLKLYKDTFSQALQRFLKLYIKGIIYKL